MTEDTGFSDEPLDLGLAPRLQVERFRRKPIPDQVRAVQLVDDDERDWEAVAAWCGGSLHNHELGDSGEYETRLALGDSHHGPRTCFAGDWVVSDGSGWFWMLTADGFAEIYEPADSAPATVTVSRDDLRLALVHVTPGAMTSADHDAIGRLAEIANPCTCPDECELEH